MEGSKGKSAWSFWKKIFAPATSIRPLRQLKALEWTEIRRSMEYVAKTDGPNTIWPVLEAISCSTEKFSSRT